MATLDDASVACMALPGVTEGRRHAHHGGEPQGLRTWFVGRKSFAWERPFSKTDIKRFGSEIPPDGPILAVRVGDLHEKQAVLQVHTGSVFTIPHFDGYAAVLLQLRKTPKRLLRELIVDAWLCTAPPSAAQTYLAADRGGRARRSPPGSRAVVAHASVASPEPSARSLLAMSTQSISDSDLGVQAPPPR